MAGDVLLTRLLARAFGCASFSMHPAHLLEVKQRVLNSNVATIMPMVNRMRRSDDATKLAAMLDRLND